MNAYNVRTDRRSIIPVLIALAAVFGIFPMAQGQQKLPDTGHLAPAQVDLGLLDSAAGEEYTIGAGDEIEVQVVGRPELSGNHLVGPDGRITLPVAGSFDIRNMSREEAARKIGESFARYYTSVDVTVRVSKYGSTRILVLGHVPQPGVLYFDTVPTLLEALSKSHAIGMGDATHQAALPQRCGIFRGKDQVFWIDLKSTLASGGVGASLRLRRDDVVYLPDDQDDMISVLGEVQRPGMVKIEAKTTLLEVLALSGGLTPNAGSAKIEIVRPGSKTTREISFKDLMDPSKNVEASLLRGDVVYVQKGTAAKFAYALQQIAPASTMLMFGATLKP